VTKMRTYKGGCHCGKVRYEVEVDLSRLYSCNCSICTKRGSVLAFVAPDKFTLLQGNGLTEYQFGKKQVHHLFCPVYGVASFGHGSSPAGEMYAINVNCLDDVDFSASQTIKVDGKSL
jgi:hypothetical protein